MTDLIPTDRSSSVAWSNKASVWNNQTVQMTGEYGSVNVGTSQVEMRLYQNGDYISVYFSPSFVDQLNKIKSGSTVTITGQVVYQDNRVTINGTAITQ